MENINLQTEQLKLNVKNINSFLIESNKKLKKQKVSKESLIRGGIEKQRFRSEERRLESPLKLGAITRVGKSIAGKTLSFFDRVKEFLGILLVGFIINRLPKIIAGVKKFFDDNPWIGKSIKFVIDIIGKGFNGIKSIVDFFTRGKRDEIKNDIKDLKSGFNKLNNELDSDISNVSSINTEGEDGGDERTTKNADDINVLSDGSIIKPGDMVGGSDFSSPEPPESSGGTNFATPEPPKLKKYAAGGKVTASQTNRRSSIGAKIASQNTEYFSSFRRNYVGLSLAQSQNEKNRETFEKILEQLKEMNGFSGLSSGKEKPMHSQPGSRSSSGSSNSSPSAGSQVYNGLPDSAIVGRVGFTGFVKPPGPAGAHVHIETGSGRGDNRGPVPSHIFDKVIVGGKPLSQWPLSSGYGYRWGNYWHDGHDFGIAAGNPIQLHKDLKLVEYAPGGNAGFGNLIMFTDKLGGTYIITHLQSGPERAPQPSENNTNSGQGPSRPGYGKGGAIVPVKTQHKVTEENDDEESSVFVQPIVIKQNTPVLVPFG